MGNFMGCVSYPVTEVLRLCNLLHKWMLLSEVVKPGQHYFVLIRVRKGTFKRNEK